MSEDEAKSADGEILSNPVNIVNKNNVNVINENVIKNKKLCIKQNKSVLETELSLVETNERINRLTKSMRKIKKSCKSNSLKGTRDQGSMTNSDYENESLVNKQYSKSDTGLEAQNNTKIKFPISHFNQFKNKPGFPTGEAMQYYLDSDLERENLLETPVLDPEILHKLSSSHQVCCKIPNSKCVFWKDYYRPPLSPGLPVTSTALKCQEYLFSVKKNFLPDLEVPELTEINMAHPPVSVLEDPSSTSSGFHTPATAPPVLNPTSSPVSPPIFQDSAFPRGETQPHFPPSRWEISSNIASILSTSTLAYNTIVQLEYSPNPVEQAVELLLILIIGYILYGLTIIDVNLILVILLYSTLLKNGLTKTILLLIGIIGKIIKGGFDIFFRIHSSLYPAIIETLNKISIKENLRKGRKTTIRFFLPVVRRYHSWFSQTIPTPMNEEELSSIYRSRTPLLIHHINSSSRISRDIDDSPSFNQNRRRHIYKIVRNQADSNKITIPDNIAQIPVKFQNNLPCFKCKIGGEESTLLIDTGSLHNILDFNILRRIEQNSGVQFPRYSHNIRLTAHQIGELDILPQGVIIPIILHEECGKELELSVPFLIERNTVPVTNILGFSQIQQYNLQFKNNYKYCSAEIIKEKPRVEPADFQAHTLIVHSILNNIAYMKHPHMNLPDGHYAPVLLHDEEVHRTDCTRLHTPSISCERFLSFSDNPSHYEDTVSLLGYDPVIWEKITFSPLDHLVESTHGLLPLRSHLAWDPDLIGRPLIAVTPVAGGAAEDCVHAPRWPTGARTSDLSSPAQDPIQTLGPTEPYKTDNELGPELIIQEIQDEFVKILNEERNDNTETEPKTGIIVEKKLSYMEAEIIIQLRTPNLVCLLCKNHCKCRPISGKYLKYIPTQIPSHYVVSGKVLLFIIPTITGEIDLDPTLIAQLMNLIDLRNWRKIMIDGQEPTCQGRKFIHGIIDTLINPYFNEEITFYLHLPTTGGGAEEPEVNNMTQFQVHPELLTAPGTNRGPSVVHNPQIIRHISLAHSTVGVPPRLLEQSEVHFLADTKGFESDLESCLQGSNPEMKEYLTNLFETYPSVCISNPSDVGIMRSEKYIMDVALKKNDLSLLPRHSPFACSLNMRKCVSRILNSWEESGIIAQSPVKTHASRIVIAKKQVSPTNLKKIKDRLMKDHQISLDMELPNSVYSIDPEYLLLEEIKQLHRICLDSRDLNKLTQPVATVSPHPETLLYDLLILLGRDKDSQLSGKFPPININELNNKPYVTPPGAPVPNAVLMKKLQKTIKEINENKSETEQLWISSLDISSAHTSMKLTPRAQFLYNLVSPDYRYYIHRRSCFGSQQVSSHWNSAIVDLLSDLIEKKVVVVYCDDILIITLGKTAHAYVVKEVIRRLCEEGLKLGLGKCHFFVQEFTYLGFAFKADGVELTDQRIRALTTFAKPTNLKLTQRFCGMINYIRHFYPNLALDLSPISDNLGTKDKFIWGRNQDEAFKKIQDTLKQGLRLNYVPMDSNLSLYVDASNSAGGAVLFSGEQSSDTFKPIAFFSRKFNQFQRDLYSSLELELLNLIDSLNKIKYFVDSGVTVQIYTDCKPILWLLKGAKRCDNIKLSRMAAKLASFDCKFNVDYTSPKTPGLFIADALSRQHLHDNQKKSTPTKLYRLIKPTDITHTLQGTFSLREISSALEENPSWVPISSLTPPKLNPAGYSTDLLPEGQDEYEEQDSLMEETIRTIHNVVDENEEPNLLDAELHGDVGVDVQQGHIQKLLVTSPSAPENMNNMNILDSDLSHERLILEQNQDPSLTEIIQYLNIHHSGQDFHLYKNKYFKKDQVLLEKVDNNLGFEASNVRICLPETLIPWIIGLHHTSLGHMGGTKLYRLLSQSYSGSKLKEKVIETTRSCHSCQLNRPSQVRHNIIPTYNIAMHPMHLLAMDHFKMTPKNGYTHALVLVDHFSGFCFIEKCRSESATHVARALENLFSIHGPCKILKSDNAKSLLRSKLVQEILIRYSVARSLLSLPYAPKHNSRAERQVKTTRDLLRLYGEKDGANWVKILPLITFIANRTPREYEQGIFSSPFELFFSRKLSPLVINPRLLLKHEEYHIMSKNEIEQISKTVNKHIQSKKEKYIQNHNKKAQLLTIEPGDLVLLKNNSVPTAGNVAAKLRPYYYSRLFTVKHIQGTLAVIVDLVNSNTMYVHTKFIKLYRTRNTDYDNIPVNIRQTMGSVFSLRETDSRRIILQKLRKARFEVDMRFKMDEPGPVDADMHPVLLSKENEPSTEHKPDTLKPTESTIQQASISTADSPEEIIQSMKSIDQNPLPTTSTNILSRASNTARSIYERVRSPWQNRLRKRT